MRHTMKETWWIDSARRDALPRELPLTIPAWMHAAATGTFLSSDRRSVTHALMNEPALLIKWRIPNPAHGFKNRWRPSRARREARVANALLAHGIDTPHAVAAAERRQGRALVASLFIRLFRSDCVPVLQAIEEGDVDSNQLMASLRAWHETGFRHGDAYPKNMLWDPANAQLMPIGFPAGRFTRGERAPIDRAAAKDVAQLLVGLWLARTPDISASHLPEMKTLLETSLGSREDPSLLWNASQARVQAILRKKQERRRTRPEREPHGPTRPQPLALDGGITVDVRELD